VPPEPPLEPIGLDALAISRSAVGFPQQLRDEAENEPSFDQAAAPTYHMQPPRPPPRSHLPVRTVPTRVPIEDIAPHGRNRLLSPHGTQYDPDGLYETVCAKPETRIRPTCIRLPPTRTPLAHM